MIAIFAMKDEFGVSVELTLVHSSNVNKFGEILLEKEDFSVWIPVHNLWHLLMHYEYVGDL